MEPLVLTETGGAVATVTLNRPDKRNALSVELRRELAAVLRSALSDPSVCAVVLTGAGTAFCAGMDTSQFGGDAANRRALVESTQELFEVLEAAPLPTIAAVNGAALGGGFVLAAACDLRLASPSATFGHPEIRFGIPPSYGALLRTLPDQIARELAFTGRTVGAEEALALGIVREVHADVIRRALALAAEMAVHGRPVLEMTKRLIVAAGKTPARRALDAELDLFRRTVLRETQ